MKVTAKGFQTFEQTGIVVDISRSFRVDVKLTIGTESQTVTVEANALAVQSDSNVVSTLINGQQITEMRHQRPQRGFGLPLSAWASAAICRTANAPTSVGASFTISFNGLSQAHNIWMIDGGEAYDRGSGGKMSMMPSQDAIGEFQVLASELSSGLRHLFRRHHQPCRIKSGTQKFHGELWEFDRNDALDAHNYFDKNTGQKKAKPELRYNIYGCNAGGPLFIPHVYNSEKKKTFFFLNEEWRKEIQGSSPNPINSIPSSDLVTSATTFNFAVPAFNNKDQIGAGVGKQIFVPLTSDPVFNAKLTAAGIALPTLNPDGTENYVAFPNNTIPGSLLDANALLFNTLKNIPAADNSATDQLTPSAVKVPINVREDLFRIDHNINDKWSIFGHFIHDAVSQNYATVLWNNDNYPTVGSNFVNPSYSSVIKLTGALKPNVLLEAAFDYDGNKIVIAPVAEAGGSFVQPAGWNAGTYFTGQNQMNRLPNITLEHL